MYAYLLSTLPSFGLDDPPPMTIDDLVGHCRPFLADDALSALSDPWSAADGSGEAAEAARRWLDGERQLRNAVARRRAATWNATPEPYLREHQGFRVEIESAVARAYEAADPLQRQHALDALRWHLLDDLAGVVPWGYAALFAYARRLAIVDAWSGRDPDDGRRRLQTILNGLEEDHVERA